MNRLLFALVGATVVSGHGEDLHDQCEHYGKKKCKAEGFGVKDGCAWHISECIPKEDLPKKKCSTLVNKACRKQKGCVFTNEECIEGGCRDIHDNYRDCIKHEQCAFQRPSGTMVYFDYSKTHTDDELDRLGIQDFGNYHKKVRDECIDISTKLGTNDFIKIGVAQYCREFSSKTKCNAPRFLAYEERLSFGLEYKLCDYTARLKRCTAYRDRTGDEERRYGRYSPSVVTDTTLESEAPEFIILPISADQELGSLELDLELEYRDTTTQLKNWDEYNDMCLSLPVETALVSGGLCEARGCVTFFDDTRVDLEQPSVHQDANALEFVPDNIGLVWCAPRRPPAVYDDMNNVDYSQYGGDPDVESLTGGARFTWWISYESYQRYGIRDLDCGMISPKYCTTVPGCNVREDESCAINFDKRPETCYTCRGKIKRSDRRLEDEENVEEYKPTAWHESVARDYYMYRRREVALEEGFEAGREKGFDEALKWAKENAYITAAGDIAFPEI